MPLMHSCSRWRRIVAGGVTALVNVISAVAATLNWKGMEATGRNIVLRALEEPVRQIASMPVTKDLL